MSTIPPAFVFPQELQSNLAHDHFDEARAIPVIDLQAPDSTLVGAVRAACETTGFFQIVGHGVPEGLMKAVQEQSRRLFELPLEQKLKGSFCAGATDQRRGFSATPKTVSPSPALIWQEGFTLIGGKRGEVDVDSYAHRLWADDLDREQRRRFSEVLSEYGDYSMKLTLRLKNLLIEALGVDPKHFEQYFERPTQVLHLTWYPPCPSPERVLGLNPHYDMGFLTLIAQDEVPGLQIRAKDGHWFTVRPVPNSFCFNVADTLEALSNGRFKSNLHRVVVNRERPRLSVTTFLSVAFDKSIEPAPELVTDERPRVYRPFTMREYMTEVRAQGINSISNCGHLLDYVKVQ